MMSTLLKRPLNCYVICKEQPRPTCLMCPSTARPRHAVVFKRAHHLMMEVEMVLLLMMEAAVAEVKAFPLLQELVYLEHTSTMLWMETIWTLLSKNMTPLTSVTPTHLQLVTITTMWHPSASRLALVELCPKILHLVSASTTQTVTGM